MPRRERKKETMGRYFSTGLVPLVLPLFSEEEEEEEEEEEGGGEEEPFAESAVPLSTEISY